MDNMIWLTLGMAAVTYLGRVSGYWFILFVKPGEKTQTFLRLVPGTIFAAMIAPALLDSGWIGWLTASVVFFLAVKMNNMFIALVVGVTVFVILRSV